MKTTYVLIDYENVQPKDLASLHGQSLKVLVFVGTNQTKVPLDLVKSLQPLGANVEYVDINGSGRNALDFHIAFYLGELAAADKGGCYYVISKDTGFDPLLAHLNARGVRARRCGSLSEMVTGGPVAVTGAGERVDAVVKNLTSRGNARPRRVKTLGSTINALFNKTLQQGEIDFLVAALERRGSIVIKDGKIAYAL
jgi:PIN domain